MAAAMVNMKKTIWRLKASFPFKKSVLSPLSLNLQHDGDLLSSSASSHCFVGRMAFFVWHWACNSASMTTNKMLYIGTSQWQTNQGLKKNVHVSFNRTIKGNAWQHEMWTSLYVVQWSNLEFLQWKSKRLIVSSSSLMIYSLWDSISLDSFGEKAKKLWRRAKNSTCFYATERGNNSVYINVLRGEMQSSNCSQ